VVLGVEAAGVSVSNNYRRRTEDAILPDIAHELVSFHRHGARCLPSGLFSVGVAGLKSYSTGNDV
jgi:hypothetical protein